MTDQTYMPINLERSIGKGEKIMAAWLAKKNIYANNLERSIEKGRKIMAA